MPRTLALTLSLLIATNLYAAPPACISHRANGAGHLENSRTALQWAIHSGAQGVEFDIQHTLDGVGIIMHDKTLERTATSRPGMSCPLNQPIGELFWFEIGQHCQLKNGESIPTFDNFLQVLKSAPEDLFRFVELKDIPSDATLRMLQEHATTPYWRLLAFDQNALHAADGLNIVSFYLYPLFLFPTNDYHLNVHYLVPSLKRFKKYAQREIGVWTVDKPNKMFRAMLMGANYITTNRPNVCQEVRKVWIKLKGE